MANRPSTLHTAYAGCLAVVLLVAADPGSAGISVTKHNLTGSNAGSVMSICVFCHTPIGDPTTSINPAWENDADTTGFTMFDDLGRFDPNREANGSVSAACLSCHDGAQAANVTMISESHPYGIPYRGVRLASIDIGSLPRESDQPAKFARYPGSASNSPQAYPSSLAFSGFREPASGVIDNAQTWWLDTGVEGRQRTDIKLYTRNFGNDILVPYVECASCHDPHTEAETFLRVENRTGSRLCLGCHEI